MIAAEGPMGGNFKRPTEYPQGNNSSRNASAPLKNLKYPSLGHNLFLKHLPALPFERQGDESIFGAHDCAQRRREKPC